MPQSQPQRPRRMKRALRRAFMRARISLYRLSGGLLGSRIPGRSFMLLTTIGRKSGLERVTPIFYLPKADQFLLIASNWGGQQQFARYQQQVTREIPIIILSPVV
jgi:F420H(2)-dependent quinone reductase